MSKSPTIGGVKMKKLGKGKPGSMKALVKRHLGDKAAEKITKSDGAKLMAKGKKTGNTELFRRGSFIKNMMKSEEAQKDYNTPAAVHKAEKTYPRFAALTDLDLNTKNRNETIKEYSYGPANPGNEEGSKRFWERKADLWDAPLEQVKSMRCNNCNAFNQTPEVKKKMADALGPKGKVIIEGSNLGYCEFFEFKCAGSRSCDAWVGGGPITEAYDVGHDYADHTNRITPGQKNYDPKYQGKKYKPAKPGSGKRVVEMEERKDMTKTRVLARSGMIPKKDLSRFEAIMRKMEKSGGDSSKLSTVERNFLASIYDDLLSAVVNDPNIFNRMRRKVKENIEEKKLTPAEKKKREEVAQAIARDNPNMPMDKKMAIATATAKRVAEDSHADGSYSKKKLKMAADAAMELDGMLGDSDDLPEWVQGKITKAADYLDSARDYMKNKGDDGKAPVGESLRVFRVSSSKLNGNVRAKDEKEAEKIFRKKGVRGKITIVDRGPVRHYRRVKNDYDLIKEETEIGGKTFDDLELCALAVKAFKKDYQQADNKQAVLDAAQAVDNYLAIERKGLEGKVDNSDLKKMKQLVDVAKKKISDAGLSANDHDYHQGHIETVEKLVKKHMNEDIVRHADIKLVKTKTPDGRTIYRKQRKEVDIERNTDKTEMYKSPAHARLQKHMDKIRKTKSYQNQVSKLGGTPLKPGEQNPMKRTANEDTVMEPVKPQEGKAKDMTAVRDFRQGKKQYKQDNEKNQKLNVKDTMKKVTMKEDMCCDDCNDHFDHVIEESMYQGKKVKLNDPIRTSEVPTKKFKVYVRDGDKIKVVRFGDPNLSIKRDDPDRRKSFRARHNCDNPGPKTKPRYWSCYQWRSGAKVDN